MPKRISGVKRSLQGIVRRYQLRVKNSAEMPEPAAVKQELNLDELMARSEAYYAQVMLSKMKRK
jgi:hypothetical protein